METHVAGLGEGLAGRGHTVSMLTSRSRPELPARETMAGVGVRRVWMPSRTPLGWAAHVAATMATHRRLARNADVFHAHTFACAPPAMASRRRFRRPFVLTLHTSHFLVRARKSAWRGLLRRFIAAADYLLATSEEIRSVAVDIYPHPRSEVMINAVDTARFRPRLDKPQGRPPHIIVPRRLFPKNGVEYFVRAMPAILAEVAGEASIVGDGPERARLERLARSLGVADRIRFLGARANSEMPELLSEADIAVIPSLMEATSIAALEAMACGLPVAASAVGGLPQIIDENVGTLFPPANPEALAAGVVALLRRPDLSKLGSEGRRRVVANWSLERLVDRHLTIYQMLLDESKDG